MRLNDWLRSLRFRLDNRQFGKHEASTRRRRLGPVAAAEHLEDRVLLTAPHFDLDSYDFLISENANIGTVLGTVRATDADGPVAYSLVSDAAGPFAINASTGSITITGALNYASTRSYAFAIQAIGGQEVDLTNVFVRVADGPKIDLAGGTNGGWSVAASTGTALATPAEWEAAANSAGWTDLATGDFDGDGRDDIAGRDANGNWRVSRSTGTSFIGESWGAGPVGTAWSDIRAADFDGDGRTDYAGRDSNGNWHVARSNGANFTDEIWGLWSTAPQWTSVFAADFTGDGKADIAGRTAGNGNWYVLTSNGSSFSTNAYWGTWSTNFTWLSISIGDFSGDGKVDIAGRISVNGNWYVSASTGTGFSSTLWGNWATVTWDSVRAADFTGDGKTDLAGRITSSGAWYVSSSTGSLFINSSSPWGTWNGTTWIDVRAADFTGDGKADIIGRPSGGNNRWVAVSQGNSFNSSVWGSWSTAWSPVVIGNFSDDSAGVSIDYPILALDDYFQAIAGNSLVAGSKVAIIGNDVDREGAQLSVSAAPVVAPQHGSLVLRTDGTFDYLADAGFSGTDYFTYSVSTGSGGARTATVWIDVQNWTDQVVGDFNGDGRQERAGRDAADGKWKVALATPEHFVIQEWQWEVATTATDFRTGDFDGDGRDDVAARDAITGDWRLALSNGTGFESVVWAGGAWNPSVAWSDALVGDFDGDGRADLAGRNSTTGEWTVSRSTGTSFVSGIWGSWATSTTWTSVFAADFTGDGQDDIIGRTAANGNWYVLRSSADSFATNAFWGNWATSVTWKDVFVADVDGDDRADVGARNDGENQTASDDVWWVARSTGASFATQNWQGYFTSAATWSWESNPGVRVLDQNHFLRAALDAFEWVRNNVRTEFYPGEMKGPQAVRETKAGNDWDQAALLEEMLEDAGVSAEIVRGVLRVPLDAAMRWTGATTATGAKNLLISAGLLKEVQPDVFTELISGIEYVRLDHAWVRANLPGPPDSIGNVLTFRDFDPSWKFLDARSGLTNILSEVPFDEAGYLSQVRDQLAFEYYEDQVSDWLAQNHPELTLADVARSGPILTQTFDAVPGLGFAVVDRNGDGLVNLDPEDGTADDVDYYVDPAAAPAIEKHRVGLTLKDASGNTLLTTSLVVPNVSLKRITLTWSGTGIPSLRLDGGVILSGNPVAIGSDVSLVIEHYDPQKTQADSRFTKTYARKAGQYVAIGLDALQFSDERLTQIRQGINTATLAIRDTQPLNPGDNVIGATLALALATYFSDAREQSREIFDLTGAIGYRNTVASGVATGEASVEYKWDLQIPAVPGKMGVDLQNLWNISAVSMDGSTTFDDAWRLIVLDNGSALEHATVEELINAESVSTVKGFQLANSADVPIPIYTFTPGTDASYIRNTLNLPDAAENQIVDATRAYNSSTNQGGFTVRVPRDQIVLPDWTGAVYIEQREEGGLFTSGYIITETAAMSGGYAAAPPSPAPVIAPKPQQSYAGDPVNTANGSMYRDETDISLPGIGIPILFARHYQSLWAADLSRSSPDIGFGAGWTHTYSDSLDLTDVDSDGDTDVVWTTSEGYRYTFKIANGIFTTPAGLFGALTVAGTIYTYREKDGLSRKFETVGSRARLIELRDRNQNVLKIEYDALGRIFRVSDATIAASPVVKLTFGYPSVSRQTVTDFAGRVWTYDFRTMRDGRRYLVSVESPSDSATEASVVRYEYDNSGGPLQGLMTRIIEPDGGGHTYTYYANRRAFEVTDAEGNTTALWYNLHRKLTDFIDERGNKSEQLYDNDGLLLRAVAPDRASTTYTWSTTTDLMMSETDAFGQTESYEYDAKGNLQQLTERDGRVTTYTYDPNFAVMKTMTVAPGTQYERQTVFTVDAANGNVTAITDPLGHRTVITYTTDGRGLVKTRTTPRGDATPNDPDDFKTTYEYNALGLVTQEIRPDADGVGIGEPAPKVVYTYDALGNLKTRTDETNRVTSYSYDLLNRRIEERLPDPYADGMVGEIVRNLFYDPMGRLVAEIGPRGGVTTRRYDLKGNLVETVSADGTSVHMDYDGAKNLIASSDPTGDITTYVYDARNRRVQTVHADGAVERTRYDGGGRAVANFDANGNETDYTYDKVGRLTSTTDAAGKAEKYEYDLVGDRYRVTDRLGRVTEYTYDKLDRVTKVRAWKEGFTAQSPPASLADFDVVTTTDYDPDGNVVEEARYDVTVLTGLSPDTDPRTIAPSRQREHKTQYDAYNRPFQWTNPDGSTRSVQYDAAGRILAEIDELGRETDREYDLAGRLYREILPDADEGTEFDDGVSRHLVTTYTADAAGNVTRAESAEYAIDGSGNLVLNTAVPAHVTTYTYDLLDQLVRTTNAEGEATDTAYDAAGRMVVTVDPLGNASRSEYDSRGRLSREVLSDPDGAGSQASPVTGYAYDAVGNLTETTDAVGRTTRYTYDELNRKVLETVPFTAEPPARAIIDDLDAGYSESNFSWGELLQNGSGVGYADRTRVNQVGTGQDNATWTFDVEAGLYRIFVTWTPASFFAVDAPFSILDGGQLLETVDVDQTLRPVGEFSDGVVWQELAAVIQVTGNQLVVRLTDDATNPAGGTIYVAADAVRIESLGALGVPGTVFTYDAVGNLLTQTDPLGRTTEWTYDGQNRVRTETGPDPDGTAGSLSAPRSESDYDALGQLTETRQIIGQSGQSGYDVRVTQYGYDAMGRQTSVLLPNPDGPGQQSAAISSTYDAVGNLKTRTDQLGRVTTYDYDRRDRQVRETLPHKNDPNLTGPQTLFRYDVFGNRFEVENALGEVTTYEHDAVGRTTSETLPDPDGSTNPQIAPRTTYDYDDAGRLTAEHRWLDATTALTTTYAYDALGRRITVTDPRNEVTAYEYDAIGRQTAVTDAESNRTAWAYDDSDPTASAITTTDPTGESRTSTYDAVGNVVEITDRNGRVRRFKYDALGRLTTEEWLDAASVVVETITRAYDDAGNLKSSSDGDASRSSTYDRLDRLDTLTIAAADGTPAVVFDYGFDPVGNLTSRSETIGGVAGATLTYVYDRLDRVTSQKQSGGGAADKLITFTYDDLGRVDVETRYADLAGTTLVAASDSDYDHAGRLTDLVHSAGATTLASYHYEYDALNRVTQVVSLADGTTDLTLDAAGQLTDADHANQADESYTYDGTGNRTNSGYVTGDANRLLEDADFSYDYDDEGNRTQRTDKTTGDYVTYDWDYRNRLVAVTSFTSAGVKTSRVEYGYDADGRRVSRKVDATGDGVFEVSERFIYAEGDVALAFSGSSLTNRYLHGPHDELFADEDALGEVLWGLADRQGTVRDLAEYDGTTSVVNHRVYDSFGTLVSESDSSKTTAFGYTGQEPDPITGLVWYSDGTPGGRWYDPNAGRFLSEDSAGLDEDTNLTRYVKNGPYDHVDPSGRFLVAPQPVLPLTLTAPAYSFSSPGSYTSPFTGGTSVVTPPQAWSFADQSGEQITAERFGGETTYYNRGIAGDLHVSGSGYETWHAKGTSVLVLGDPVDFARRDYATQVKIAEIESPTARVALGTLHEWDLHFNRWAGFAPPRVPELESPALRSNRDNTERAIDIATFSGGSAYGFKGAGGTAVAASLESSVAPQSPLLQRYLSESGGRWGGTATRALNHKLATELEYQGYRITGGAGRASEQWIPGAGGGTKGGTFVDITAKSGTTTVRIQTIDTLADGITPTSAEAAAAARIRAAFPNDTLRLIPKR